jgi:serine/threonine-protein kinase
MARVSALLDEALELPATERTAWQADLATREPRLSAVVLRLLASMQPADTPAARRMETADLVRRGVERAMRAPAAPDPITLTGRRFGPYRVTRLLGQGGMGSVWLAQRDDGLFERQVALKLVHASLFGHALGERFARERSILGALDHPHIARLLDAGVSDDGQPYLALEYVEGESLTHFCDSRRLTLPKRLSLMLQVLSAVQHAHQNLVIHRDLKPANILVTPHGQVRLLDFGIAKLMTDGEARETELTQMAGRALTLEYASPEQVAGRAVSTASDVYSLGVVLYGLLCGQRPYAPTRATHAALEEAVLHADPLRPSQQPLDDAAAQARSSSPRKLHQALAGDLDTIVLKALKKDPAQRYPTADALREDLQRYLAGQPVQAQPDSAGYRLRKFVGRHRRQVLAAASVLLLLAGAAGISIWQGQIAREQARVAQRESQRAQAVQAFLTSIFSTNSLQQADPLRARQTTARELLDVGARQAVNALKDTPEALEDVLETLANMYFQLGLFDEAARLRQQRVEVLRQAFGPADARLAHALLAYARDANGNDDRAGALAALNEARQVLDASGDFASETRGWMWINMAEIEQYSSIARMRRAAQEAVNHFRAHPAQSSSYYEALRNLARAHHLAGDALAAQALLKEDLAEIARHEPGPTAWSVTPLVQLAEAQQARFDFTSAEKNLREALALSTRLSGALNGATLQTQAKLGGLLHAIGRRGEGWAQLDAVQAAVAQPEANATPAAVGTLHRFRGDALLAEGRLAEADRAYQPEVDDLRAHYADTAPLSRLLLLQAGAWTALGRYEDSARQIADAHRIWRTVGGEAVHPSTHNRFVFEAVRLLLARGQAQAALQRLGEIAEPPAAAQLPLDADTVQLSLARAQAALQLGRFADAQSQAQQALERLARSPLRPQFTALEAEALLVRGQALRGAGDARAAREPLTRAVALREPLADAGSPWLAEARIALAHCLLDLREREAAGRLLQQALTAQRAHTELAPHFKAPLAALQARWQQPR